MRIAGLKLNDCIDGDGITVSLWTQGCPHRCPGCHNPETWDFKGGYEEPEIKGKIIKGIGANGIERNFSILGGEPLCEENKENVLMILTCVKIAYPKIKIFLWTGYEYEYLISLNDDCINEILSKVDILIDGRFKQEERDLTLYLCGSKNQKVIDLQKMRKENTNIPILLIDKQEKICYNIEKEKNIVEDGE